MEYQIPCDQCDITEDESKLIETFDNQLLIALFVFHVLNLDTLNKTYPGIKHNLKSLIYF